MRPSTLFLATFAVAPVISAVVPPAVTRAVTLPANFEWFRYAMQDIKVATYACNNEVMELSKGNKVS